MLGAYLDAIRRSEPMVHCMVNLVTANDCANLVLASGASAIMAQDKGEAAQITELCNATVLNLGTPSPDKIQALCLAGRRAYQLGHPTVFDPVGVGASSLRSEAAEGILRQVHPTVIRGNTSEIQTLLGIHETSRGVDAGPASLQKGSEAAQALARRIGGVVVLSGRQDIVTDGSAVYLVSNGVPIMSRVTGTGCQLSCLMGCFLGASPGDPLGAALACVCAMGLCGQIAAERMGKLDGNATFRNYLIDAMYHLSGEALEKGASYEIL